PSCASDRRAAPTVTDTTSNAPEAQSERPPLRFWLGLSLAYLVLVALGLVFPVLGRATGRLTLWVNMLGYVLSGIAMIGAAFCLSLMICRVRLPYVWWLHRVQGLDVSEYDGVYFVGGSVDGVSEGARSKVFSADDARSRWDITFGVITTVLAVLHGGA